MTIGQLLGLLTVIVGAWVISQWVIDRWRRRRESPTAIDELRANIQERQESVRKAAATEYRRKREPWNP